MPPGQATLPVLPSPQVGSVDPPAADAQSEVRVPGIAGAGVTDWLPAEVVSVAAVDSAGLAAAACAASAFCGMRPFAASGLGCPS